MKLSLFVCDRCDARMEARKDVDVPDGWDWITTGTLFCGQCMQDFDAFKRGARIEHVAVER